MAVIVRANITTLQPPNRSGWFTLDCDYSCDSLDADGGGVNPVPAKLWASNSSDMTAVVSYNRNNQPRTINVPPGTVDASVAFNNPKQADSLTYNGVSWQ